MIITVMKMSNMKVRVAKKRQTAIRGLHAPNFYSDGAQIPQVTELLSE